MPENSTPTEAVRIVEGGGVVRPLVAQRTVAALAQAGWLISPERREALWNVANAARSLRPRRMHTMPSDETLSAVDRLSEALDALDALLDLPEAQRGD